MEILSICIKTTKSTWLEIYNVYLPNTSTQHSLFDPSLIKPGPSFLILGDLKYQSGDKILEWILDNDQHIVNDGFSTRTSQITGNNSTPDISLCGSSDHRPILIEINHKIRYNPVVPRAARWR